MGAGRKSPGASISKYVRVTSWAPDIHSRKQTGPGVYPGPVGFATGTGPAYWPAVVSGTVLLINALSPSTLVLS